MPSRQPSPESEEETTDGAPRRKRRFAVPVITLLSLGAFLAVGLYRLPKLREKWAFERIRDQQGHVELKSDRGRKYVDIDLSSVEEPSSDLESLNSFYPVERLVASPKTDDASMERIGRLAGLRYLKLENAAITDVSLPALAQLPDLSELSLAGTQISEAGLENLAKARGLTRLDLNGLAIRGEGLAALNDLPKLSEIRLQDTLLDDSGLTALGTLANLRKLKLSRTRISDAGLAALKDLKKLEMLDLDGTQISDKGLEELKPLSRLTELSLNETRVSNAGLEHLAGLTSLDTLRVDNTRMTNDKIVEFMSTRKIMRTEVTGGFKKEGEFPDEIYFGYAGLTKDEGPLRGGMEAIATPEQPAKFEEETAPDIMTEVEWSKQTGKYSHHRLPLGEYVVFARCGDFYDMRWVVIDGTKNVARLDFILNRKAAATVEVKLPADDPQQSVTLFELKRDKKDPDKTNEAFPVASGMEIETINGFAKFRIPSGTYMIGHGGKEKRISPRGQETLPVEF